MSNAKDCVKLDWLPLVESVKRGEFEPRDETGRVRFMYSVVRNTFLSDPNIIAQITYARSHSRPMMLVGEFGTGKNVFLELIARGDNPDERMDCVDENVVGSEAEMLEKFFGRNGVVERHPHSLLHFDLLQNAVTWPVFMDKLLQLAFSGVLYRTDGTTIRDLGVRVVGGATVDLEDFADLRTLPHIKYLYEFLRASQFARTLKLVDLRDRMQQLLTESLAAQVLDRQSSTPLERVRALQEIPQSVLSTLQEYDWPDQFYELLRFVRTSIIRGQWAVEALLRTPLTQLRTFISYSSADRDAANGVCEFLSAHNIDVWIDNKKLVPGSEWKREIAREGYFQLEIRRLLERVDQLPRGQIFLIPLRLEECAVPRELLNYQYADFFESTGRSGLITALRNRGSSIGRQSLAKDS
jgi:TIR domain-containing protein